MVHFNEKYEKVWYVHLSMDVYRQPKVLVDEYENVVIKQSTLNSFERCDIVCAGKTRPFCRVCDVFNNEEDAEKYKKLLTLKADDLISTYAKEMVEYIQEIFKKVGFGEKPKQFIANAHQIKHSNSLTWSRLNCHKLILTNGCTLNLESVTDIDLLFNIILDIKNRHYFVLSEDYDSHKKFNSLSIYELSTAVEEFMLKLKGYLVC
jgi:hypothetical protein